MKLFPHKSPSERGQSMVELAISFFVLLLLLAGITDIGRAFFTFSALRDAAQEGATYGSINPADTGGIIARVRGSSNDPIDLASPFITIGVKILGQPCIGNGIDVTVTYKGFQFIFPLMRTIAGTDTIDLSAHVTDEIIRPPCQ
jgi:Flp pilus assembly protein TadG